MIPLSRDEMRGGILFGVLKKKVTPHRSAKHDYFSRGRFFSILRNRRMFKEATVILLDCVIF